MPPVSALIVFGTRPEVIKLAPLVMHCAHSSEHIKPIVCMTGQHRELVTPALEYFGLTVDENLDVLTRGQSLVDVAARCLQGTREVISRRRPECVVVQGDTTSAMAAALAAFYEQVPVVHVEAGLRSSNLLAPWPEELNRRVVTLTAALHCAPTTHAANSLIAEGVSPSLIHVTGNTVIDALRWTVERERKNGSSWGVQFPYLERDRLVLITSHRRENFREGLAKLCDAVRVMSPQFPHMQFVWPVHLNPNVDTPVRNALSGLKNVHLLPPAPYPQFVWLMDRAALIITDSGGIQEEAPALKKRVLVLRESTERPEALDTGLVEIVGTDLDKLVSRATHWLETYSGTQPFGQLTSSPFGDGNSAARIAQLIAHRAWLA